MLNCTRCKAPVYTRFKWQQTPEFTKLPFCDRHCESAYNFEHGPQIKIRVTTKATFAAERKRYHG